LKNIVPAENLLSHRLWVRKENGEVVCLDAEEVLFRCLLGVIALRDSFIFTVLQVLEVNED
jgi:hypothetical protein